MIGRETHKYLRIRTHTHTHTCTCTHALAHTHARISSALVMHTHARAHMHTFEHAHTHSLSFSLSHALSSIPYTLLYPIPQPQWQTAQRDMLANGMKPIRFHLPKSVQTGFAAVTQAK